MTLYTWIFYFVLVALPLTDSVMMDNEFCGTRPTLVALDPVNHDYFPYFVTLSRCGGSCNTVPPNIFHCVAKTQTNVVLDVFSILSGTLEQVVLKNDTSCGCECVVKEDQCDPQMQVYKPDRCRCECKFNETSIECAQNFKWNQEHCECLCDLEPQPCRDNMIWSPQDCRCQCSGIDQNRCMKRGKILDEEDCVCVDAIPEVGRRIGQNQDTWNVSMSVVAVIIIAMLLLILIVFLISDLYFNYCKRPSLIRSVFGRRSQTTKDNNVEMDNCNHNQTPNHQLTNNDRVHSYEVINGKTNRREIHTDIL
uniref:Toxin candidate TRINITY_DN17559_c0_g1_i1 n=1 Tax=Ceriantheomorphe brasiliensis TaxID=1048506 RepID=A0A7G7WZ71_9CNID|nr:toxin candidate TRINITY_DN17559_c0_g1_i1 [Ceriantheomorphe brasiliensis]